MSHKGKRSIRSASECSKSRSDSCSFPVNLKEYCENLTVEELQRANGEWLERISKERPLLLDQVPMILTAIQIQPFYYGYFQNICHEVENIVRTCYPHSIVQAKPFGSTATFLALKDSDVDVFLQFDVMPEPPDALVKTLRKEFYRRHQNFSQVFAIFAKVPILRVRHNNGIFCDISFSSAHGVINSHLVSFIISIDDRIWPLIMMLKYWQRKQELSGSNALTSYALIMLVVYFLQQINKPILPSVHFLQTLSSLHTFVTDWDVSFCHDRSLIPPIENKSSLFDLLSAFFSFYANFEFGLYVISPFIGKAILKPQFANPSCLPSEYTLYKNNLAKDVENEFDLDKWFCVQDPFKHCHNITRNAPKKVSLKFIERCAAAYEICLEEKKKSLDKSDYHSVFFEELFRSIDGNEKFKKPKLVNHHIVIYLNKDLVFDKEKTDFTEEGLRLSWRDAVLDILNDILSKIMKCEVERCEVDTSVEISDKVVSITKFNCQMTKLLLTTKKRNQAKQELNCPKALQLMKKEEMISDRLCEKYDQKDFLLSFDVTASMKKNPTNIALELSSQGSTTAFLKSIATQTFSLMENILPKWIDITLGSQSAFKKIISEVPEP